VSVSDGRRGEIIAVAGRLLEEHGPDGVTMRAIASELGIQAPSLYKHIADKRELEVALIAGAFRQQAEAFERAAAAGEDAIETFARGYRAWALEHRHLYRLMNDQPLPRDELPEGVEERASSPLIEALGGSLDHARAAWAFAHGMVTLEIAERFPPDADIDAAWRVGIAAIANAMKINTREESS
jgi:AcrR family transcriptional regulator